MCSDLGKGRPSEGSIFSVASVTCTCSKLDWFGRLLYHGRIFTGQAIDVQLAIVARRPTHAALALGFAMTLLLDGEPFELRPHQLECATLAMQENIICAQPTGDGKTIIAADVIRQTLQVEETRKVVFLAPYGALAQQQYFVFTRHIERLHIGDDVTPKEDASEAELARWRIGLCAGGDSGVVPELATEWRFAFKECQLLVMTPALFEVALIHNAVSMSDIALLVFDEAHEASETSKHHYSTILHYFFFPCPCASRPRVLALTATPIAEPAPKKDPNTGEIIDPTVQVCPSTLEHPLLQQSLPPVTLLALFSP